MNSTDELATHGNHGDHGKGVALLESAHAARATATTPAKLERAVRGLRPGARFASQVSVVAHVFRSFGLVASVQGEVFSPDELERLAVEQAADEQQLARLVQALGEFFIPYTARANARAKRLSASLTAARGMLKDNPVGLAALKKARFNGSRSRVAKAQPEAKK